VFKRPWRIRNARARAGAVNWKPGKRQLPKAPAADGHNAPSESVEEYRSPSAPIYIIQQLAVVCELQKM